VPSMGSGRWQARDREQDGASVFLSQVASVDLLHLP
jgi:hypothetical protein